MTQAYVYILQSDRNGRYYVGHSSDVQARLVAHNARAVTSTRHLVPWQLVYVETCVDVTPARKREWQLKSWKSEAPLKPLFSTPEPVTAPTTSGRSNQLS
jgi:putative endonuclease